VYVRRLRLGGGDNDSNDKDKKDGWVDRKEEGEEDFIERYRTDEDITKEEERKGGEKIYGKNIWMI
jgi:hypothetical protein